MVVLHAVAAIGYLLIFKVRLAASSAIVRSAAAVHLQPAVVSATPTITKSLKGLQNPCSRAPRAPQHMRQRAVHW